MEDLKVTRDVIADLLPVVESGEATDDSRKLVQNFLERDPEFARLVLKLKQTKITPAQPALPPELEMKSLARTKRQMSNQTSCLVVAIFFSLAPFVFTWEGKHINWWLIRDAPVVGGCYLLTAIIMWIAYLVMKRKLKFFSS